MRLTAASERTSDRGDSGDCPPASMSLSSPSHRPNRCAVPAPSLHAASAVLPPAYPEYRNRSLQRANVARTRKISVSAIIYPGLYSSIVWSPGGILGPILRKKLETEAMERVITIRRTAKETTSNLIASASLVVSLSLSPSVKASARVSLTSGGRPRRGRSPPPLLLSGRRRLRSRRSAGGGRRR